MGARLQPLPIEALTLDVDGFWGRRLETLRAVTLSTQHARMEETGRLENFRRAAGRAPAGTPFHGFVFNDSDVYKWIEAAAWALASAPGDRNLRALLDGVVGDVVAAQQPDGYLNTCFVGERASERFTNIRDFHELYCAGHLIQAGIAHRRATREDRLFEAAMRYAGLIGDVFGPGRRQEPPGHPEIEMALVELHRETGGTRWLDLARFFLDQRGYGHVGGSVYHVDHAPFTELHDIAGHAVRALYLCSGATDLLLEGAGEDLRGPIGRLWRSAFERKAYVTGGMGSDPAFEAFGEDFDLPNETAYAETCAAVAGVLWNWRLLLATGEARFADEMERALFNGALSGIGLDGCSYFYLNPLASHGDHRRQPYFDCACCPPNIARLLAMLPGLFVSTGPNEVWLHQYGSARIDVDLPPASGRPGSIRIDVTTDYPGDGEVEVKVRTTEGPSRFRLRLRVPGWAVAGSATVNGAPAGESGGGAYLALDREWRDGDKVHLSIPMPPRFVPAPRWSRPIGAGWRSPEVRSSTASSRRTIRTGMFGISSSTRSHRSWWNRATCSGASWSCEAKRGSPRRTRWPAAARHDSPRSPIPRGPTVNRGRCTSGRGACPEHLPRGVHRVEGILGLVPYEVLVKQGEANLLLLEVVEQPQMVEPVQEAAHHPEVALPRLRARASP